MVSICVTVYVWNEHVEKIEIAIEVTDYEFVVEIMMKMSDTAHLLAVSVSRRGETLNTSALSYMRQEWTFIDVSTAV